MGKAKYELEFEAQRQEGLSAEKVSFYHHIDRIGVYEDSRISDAELNEYVGRVCELISEVQREMFDRELESEKWQTITNPRVYRRYVKRYFKKLNKPLRRMSGRERKEFLSLAIAFLEYGADDHVKNFIKELHTKKRPRDVIAKYKKPIPVRLAADTEEWE